MLKDDEEEEKLGKETLNKMVKFAEFNTSEVINEARLLLQCESPLVLDEMTSVMTSPVHSTGLPVNRQLNGPLLPAIKNTKTNRKSVRFNMEKNVTFNVQPATYHSPDSDSESTDDNNSDNIIRNGGNASELGITDDESDDDDDDDDGRNQTNKTEIITYSDKVTIMGEINDMEKQKGKLAKELEQLRGRHEKEMKQLREEYRRRREDYYDELDEVQAEMNQRRNEYNLEISDLQDMTSLKERKQNYEEERKMIEEKEEELQQKKTSILEMEKELQEYEAYLERRHKSLNKKEGDLCVLQDELEELADALKEEEARLKSKQQRNADSTKVCKHDDTEIEKTGILLNNSLKAEREMQEKLKIKDQEIDEKNNSISQLQEEKEKLEIKIKHLESQFSLNKLHSPSHFEKQTSLRRISSVTPADESVPRSLSRRRLSLDDSNSGSIHLSPRINKRSSVKSPTREPRISVFSKTSSTKSPPVVVCSSENITEDQEPFVPNDVGNEFDETGIYAADTTLPRLSTKPSIIKTCSLM